MDGSRKDAVEDVWGGGQFGTACERKYIEFVLGQYGNNINKAARWLRLHRQNLQKLRKFSAHLAFEYRRVFAPTRTPSVGMHYATPVSILQQPYSAPSGSLNFYSECSWCNRLS
ncbi:MAG: hypothetical protein H6617_10285 [Bdellovibrionaceae bacterium]|nr:hypothetical protein [Pseudobdellovibrionaceae bacterium]